MKIQRIEKNVKIPEVKSKFKYPWPDMDVKDSVFIESDEGQTLFQLKRIVSPGAVYYGNMTSKKFKCLMMREENGVRVWRLE